MCVCVLQGDGLEFKRLFLKIKQKLSDIISTQRIPLPVTWSDAICVKEHTHQKTSGGVFYHPHAYRKSTKSPHQDSKTRKNLLRGYISQVPMRIDHFKLREKDFEWNTFQVPTRIVTHMVCVVAVAGTINRKWSSPTILITYHRHFAEIIYDQ